MPTQNFVIGNKTRLFFTILPDALRDNPIEPVDVALTNTAAVATLATTIPVAALSGPVPIGTPLTFKKTGQPDSIVYTTASANQGALSIAVEPVATAIAITSVAQYTSMLLLVGGTTADESVTAADTATTVFGDALGFSTGVVTSQSWSISYSFNVLPADAGFGRMAYAATRAVDGVLGWIKKEDPAPAGYTKGDSIAGVVALTDYSKSNSADGIITGSLTFTGRGAPTIKRYS